jgi:hypothetical protein
MCTGGFLKANRDSFKHEHASASAEQDQDQPGRYMIAGEGSAVGRDTGDPLTKDYPGERPYRPPAAPSPEWPST